MLTLRETDKIFKNAASIRIREISIVSAGVGVTLESCRLLFESLDRSDPYQAAINKKVWELRSSVLFTLLPFDSSFLGLSEISEAIVRDADRVPSIGNEARKLEESISGLLRQPVNPKHAWLTSCESVNFVTPGEIGLFAMRAMGRIFGWPGSENGKLEVPFPVRVIDSPKKLRSSVFGRIIVPGTCHYLSNSLFLEIFYKGRAESVDVLLYPGERFVLRRRTPLPQSNLFRNRIVLSKPSVCRVAPELPSEATLDDTDVRMKESLWQLSRGSLGEAGPQKKPARYILFTDGRGVFVPNGVLVMMIPEDGLVEGVELDAVPFDRLSEGDLLIMQTGDTGHLLEAVSAKGGFDQKLENACDWRPALERLLLTVEPEQVAEDMLALGATGLSLAHSVRNWADGTVYGPAHSREFRALIDVLARHGKLPDLHDLDEYVASRWSRLQELRGIRQRAGQNVHSELVRQLADVLGRTSPVKEGQSIVTEGAVTFRLRRVAAIDDRISWVPAAKLMPLHVMRGS